MSLSKSHTPSEQLQSSDTQTPGSAVSFTKNHPPLEIVRKFLERNFKAQFFNNSTKNNDYFIG
jgi:hypothetical protein